MKLFLLVLALLLVVVSEIALVSWGVMLLLGILNVGASYVQSVAGVVLVNIAGSLLGNKSV